MRKVLLVFVALLVAIGFGSAQDQDFSKVEIKVTKVAGNVYMLQGHSELTRYYHVAPAPVLAAADSPKAALPLRRT